MTFRYLDTICVYKGVHFFALYLLFSDSLIKYKSNSFLKWCEIYVIHRLTVDIFLL